MKRVSIEISCAAVKAKLDAGDSFLLLDCREADEFEIVHLEQSTLLPMSEIQRRVAELDEHRDREIIVHCHHGARSLNVAMWLRQQGFPKAQSMSGGIEQWAVEIDPTLARY